VAEGYTASACRSRGEQFVTERRVLCDRVVMDIDVHVVAVGQCQVVGQAVVRDAGAGNGVGSRSTCEEGIGMFALTHGDAARHGALVVEHAVVRDLELMTPGVNPDAAAALRAVLDGEAVNAGRVAGAGAGVRIGQRTSVWSAAIAIASSSGERSGPAVKKLSAGGEDVGGKRIRPCGEPYAFAEDRDASAFIGAHQGGLDQLLGQVSVECCIPSNRGFEGQPIDLELHVRRAAGWCR